MDAMNCSICYNRGYNSSGIWAVDGKNPGNLGYLYGKSVKDSVCISTILDQCYSNKTEDHYEFLLVQGSKIGLLNGLQSSDGVIGLAPGSNGYKSYGEYLIDRNIISKNTANAIISPD